MEIKVGEDISVEYLENESRINVIERITRKDKQLVHKFHIADINDKYTTLDRVEKFVNELKAIEDTRLEFKKAFEKRFQIN